MESIVRSKLSAWLERAGAWHKSLSPAQKLLMAGALLACAASGSGALLVGAGIARAALGIVAGAGMYYTVAPQYGHVAGLAAGGLIAFLGARTLGTIVEHGIGIVSDASAAIMPVPYEGILDNAPLTGESFDATLLDLGAHAEKADKALETWSRLVPADHHLVKGLRESSEYYHAMHDKLAALSAKVHKLDEMRGRVLAGSLTAPHTWRLEADIHKSISAIRDADGRGLTSALLANAEHDVREAQALFQKAVPGSVIRTDASGHDYWHPLAGDKARGLAPLIEFVDTKSQLPLSTSRVLMNLVDELRRNSIDPILADTKLPWQASVTGGYPFGDGIHKIGGTHYRGIAVDFSIADKSPRSIARVLACADKTDGATLYWELPSGNEKLEEARVAAELIHFGYTPERALAIAQKCVRVVPWADGTHFHLDTPDPAIFAPSHLMAKSG